MAVYCRVVDGVVIDRILAQTAPSAEFIQNDLAQIGWTYDGSVFSPPVVSDPPPEPAPAVMTIDLDQTQVAVNTQVTATINVLLDGAQDPITDTFYVPVIRDADGLQKEFLTVAIANGAGSVSFSLPDKGKYSIRLDKITPLPTAKLPVNPVLIVT